MAGYAVECVDRDTGNPYMVRVDAETEQQAVYEVSKAHVAGKAHRVEPTRSTPPPAAPPELLRAIQEQNHLLRRIEEWSMRTSHSQGSIRQMILRAAVYTVTAVVVLVAIGLVAAVVLGDPPPWLPIK